MSKNSPRINAIATSHRGQLAGSQMPSESHLFKTIYPNGAVLTQAKSIALGLSAIKGTRTDKYHGKTTGLSKSGANILIIKFLLRQIN